MTHTPEQNREAANEIRARISTIIFIASVVLRVIYHTELSEIPLELSDSFRVFPLFFLHESLNDV